MHAHAQEKVKRCVCAGNGGGDRVCSVLVAPADVNAQRLVHEIVGELTHLCSEVAYS